MTEEKDLLDDVCYEAAAMQYVDALLPHQICTTQRTVQQLKSILCDVGLTVDEANRLLEVMERAKLPRPATRAATPTEVVLSEQVATAPPISVDRGNLQQQTLSANQIRCIVEEANANTKCLEGKHIVGFVGATGSGKTTTMLWLCGVPMHVVTDPLTGKEVIEPTVDVGLHRVGHRGSETRSMFFQECPTTPDTFYTDLPGDKDTSNKMDVLIRNALLKAFALRRAKSVRLVLVVQIDQLNATRGANLPSDLAEVLDLIANTSVLSSLLTLMSPVARGSQNLAAALTTRSDAALLELCQGAVRGVEAVGNEYFTALKTQISNSLEIAADARRNEVDRIKNCKAFIANPLQGNPGRERLKNLIFELPAVHTPATAFRIALPFTAETHLREGLRQLIDDVRRGLADDAGPELECLAAEHALSALKICHTLSVDLGLSNECFRRALNDTRELLNRRWNDAYAAAFRALSTKCAGELGVKMKKLHDLESVVYCQLRPLFVTNRTLEHISQEFYNSVSSFYDEISLENAISVIDVAAKAQKVWSLEECLALPSDERPSDAFRRRVHKFLVLLSNSIKGIFDAAGGPPNPFVLAQKLKFLLDADAALGSKWIPASQVSIKTLFEAAKKRLLDEIEAEALVLKTAVTKMAMEGQLVGSEATKQRMSALYMFLASADIQSVLDDTTLVNRYFEPISAAEDLGSYLFDLHDCDRLIRLLAVYDVLIASGDPLTAERMKAKRQESIDKIRTVAKQAYNDFGTKLRETYVAEKKSWRQMNREPSGQFEPQEPSAIADNFRSLAVLVHTDRVLQHPFCISLLKKMIVMIEDIANDLIKELPAYLISPSLDRRVVPLIDFVTQALHEVICGPQLTICEIAEVAQTEVENSRQRCKRREATIYSLVTEYVDKIQDVCVSADGKPIPGWVTMFSNGFDALTAIERGAIPSTIVSESCCKKRAAMDKNENTYIESLGQRINSAAEDEQIETLAELVVAEATPLLESDVPRWQRCGHQFKKSLDRYVNQLVEKSHNLDIQLAPEEVCSVFARLTSLSRVMSRIDENNQYATKVETALNNIRSKITETGSNLIKAVTGPTIDFMTVSLLISQIPALPQPVLTAVTNRLSVALQNKVSTLILSLQGCLGNQQIAPEVSMLFSQLSNLMINEQVKSYLNPQVSSEWLRAKKLVEERVSNARSELQEALATNNGFEISLAQSKYTALRDFINALGHVEPVAVEYNKHLQKTLQNANNDIFAIMESYKREFLNEGLRRSESMAWSTFARNVRTAIMAEITLLNNASRAASREQNFEKLSNLIEQLKKLLDEAALLVTDDPAISELLDCGKRYLEELRGDTSEAELLKRIDSSAAHGDPASTVAEMLRRSTTLSPKGRTTVIDKIRCLSQDTCQEPTAAEPKTTVIKRVVVSRSVLEVMQSCIPQLEETSPEFAKEVIWCRDTFTDYLKQNQNHSQQALEQLLEDTIALMNACVVTKELIFSMRMVDGIADTLSLEQKSVYEEKVKILGHNIKSLVGTSVSHIRKGELDGVNWNALQQCVGGLQRLAPDERRYFSAKTTNVTFERLQNDLTDAAKSITTQLNVDKAVDSGDYASLMAYYEKVKKLHSELSGIIPVVPPPTFDDADLVALLKKLRDVAILKWNAASQYFQHNYDSVTPDLHEYNANVSGLIVIHGALKDRKVVATAADKARLALSEAKIPVLEYCTNVVARVAGTTDFKVIADCITHLRQIAFDAPCTLDILRNAAGKILLQFKTICDSAGTANLNMQLLRSGAAGVQVISDHPQFFADAGSSLWKERAGELSVDVCVERLECDPELLPGERSQLHAMLSHHVAEVKRLKDEFFLRCKTPLKARDAGLEMIKKTSTATSQGIADVISILCAMFSLYSMNSAEAEATNLEKMITPHTTQVLTIYRLLGLEKRDGFFTRAASFFSSTASKAKTLQNHMVQILTGEGKSITLGILSALCVTMKLEVDVVCYSEYLTKRDEATMRPFFEFLGFKGDSIRYMTFEQLCAKRLEGVAEIASHVLQTGKPYQAASRRLSGNARILLIDEVDVFFTKRFYGATYNAGVTIKSNAITKLVRVIFDNRGKPFDVATSKELNDVLKEFSPPILSPLLKALASKLVENSNCFAARKYQFNRNTKLFEYKIGDSYDSSIVYPNETMFLYLNMVGSELTQEEAAAHVGIDCFFGQFSFAEIPSKEYYFGILGVTGTLRTLGTPSEPHGHFIISEDDRRILHDSYGVNRFTFAPSVFGAPKLNNCRGVNYRDHCTLFYSDPDWASAIEKTAVDIADQGGACLIFCKNKQRLDQLLTQPLLRKRAFVITEATPTEERQGLVTAATIKGKITLLTRSFGRGTDFFCVDKTVVTVLQTFYSSTESEMVQIKGRTARQGQEGNYRLMLCTPHLHPKFFFDELRTATEQTVANVVANINKMLDDADKAGTLESLLLARQELKTATKTRSREDGRAAARVLDIASWGIVDKLLGGAPVEQQLSAVASASLRNIAQPTLYVPVLDHSGSMDGVPWTALGGSFQSFINELLKAPTVEMTKLSVIFFGSNAQERYRGPVAKYALPSSCPGGGTNFAAAFKKVGEVFDAPEFSDYRKNIVFLTDGFGDSPMLEIQNIIKNHQSQIGMFYCIFFCKGPVPSQLTEVVQQFSSSKIPTQLIHPTDSVQLNAAMKAAVHSGPMHRH